MDQQPNRDNRSSQQMLKIIANLTSAIHTLQDANNNYSPPAPPQSRSRKILENLLKYFLLIGLPTAGAFFARNVISDNWMVTGIAGPFIGLFTLLTLAYLYDVLSVKLRANYKNRHDTLETISRIDDPGIRANVTNVIDALRTLPSAAEGGMLNCSENLGQRVLAIVADPHSSTLHQLELLSLELRDYYLTVQQGYVVRLGDAVAHLHPEIKIDIAAHQAEQRYEEIKLMVPVNAFENHDRKEGEAKIVSQHPNYQLMGEEKEGEESVQSANEKTLLLSAIQKQPTT